MKIKKKNYVRKPHNILIINIWKNCIFLILSILFFSCSGPLKLNEFNLADEYNLDGLKYEMNCSFQSLNDSTSNLIIQINPNDLLFSKNDSGFYTAKYTIEYKIFNGYNNKKPLDTAQFHFDIRHHRKIKKKLHYLKLIAPIGNDYVVKISLKDENRNQVTSKIITLRKKTFFDRSYFKITPTKKDVENFTVFQKDSFSLTPPSNFLTSIKVMTFEYKSTCAANPYETEHSYRFPSIPDSTWNVSGLRTYKFPPLKNGFYHFITDTLRKEGFSIFSVNQSFPNVNSIQQANNSLGYLLEKSEYVDLLKDYNPKRAFEKKWLEISGSRSTARNLIKTYYLEVSRANKLFTNIELGWTTDRGMIYIIYGSPKIVYRNQNSEVWIYDEEQNLLNEEFEFEKIKTNLTDDLYELKRNTNFKINFNRMVKVWIDERGF